MYGAPGAHVRCKRLTNTLLHYITKDYHSFTLHYKIVPLFYITLQKTVTLLHYITKECRSFTLHYKSITLLHYITKIITLLYYITLQNSITLLHYVTKDCHSFTLHYKRLSLVYITKECHSFTLQKSITLLHYITKDKFHCPPSRGVQHQDPAAFDQRFIDIVKQPLMTRYRLLPYLYTLLYKAHLHGDTVMRPLLFE